MCWINRKLLKKAIKTLCLGTILCSPMIVALLIGYFVSSYAYPLVIIWFFVLYVLIKGQRWNSGS